MRNVAPQFNVTPLSSIVHSVRDNAILLPLVGVGGAAINVSSITRGYPTVVTLASTPACIGGQVVKFSSIGGTTDVNGYRSVLYVTGNSVVIDYDTTYSQPYTSGGSVAFNVIYDSLENIQPQDVQGTITGIWSSVSSGLTSHSGGSYTNLVTNNIDALDLSTFRGVLVLSLTVTVGQLPSHTETIFSLGVQSATGNNTASGAITASLESTGVCQFCIRMAGGVNGACTNLFVNSGNLGLGTRRKVALLIDFTNFPTTVNAHIIVDGVYRSVSSVSLAGAISPPANTVGYVFGGQLSNTLTITNNFGAAATPSGGAVRQLLWWRSGKNLIDTISAVVDFHRLGEITGKFV